MKTLQLDLRPSPPPPEKKHRERVFKYDWCLHNRATPLNPNTSVCGAGSNIAMIFLGARYRWKPFIFSSVGWEKYAQVWLNRLVSRNNIFDPDFFLWSDNVLKFRIFWSVLVTAYYINP